MSPVAQAMEEATTSTRTLQMRNENRNFRSGDRRPGSDMGSNHEDQIK
jgi:hypothetical protein